MILGRLVHGEELVAALDMDGWHSSDRMMQEYLQERFGLQKRFFSAVAPPGLFNLADAARVLECDYRYDAPLEEGPDVRAE